jgi:hypothetical protein
MVSAIIGLSEGNVGVAVMAGALAAEGADPLDLSTDASAAPQQAADRDEEDRKRLSAPTNIPTSVDALLRPEPRARYSLYTSRRAITPSGS